MPSMSTPGTFHRALRASALLVERVLHGVWRPLTRALGWRRPRSIVAYRSYGTGETIWVQGRVLGNPPAVPAREEDGWWQVLQHTRRRWITFEVPGARVGVRFEGKELELRADRDGYFSAEFDRVGAAAEETCWLDAESWSVDQPEVQGAHEILVPGTKATFMVISDVDDTVIHTGATRLWTILRLTFFTNVFRRRVLDGTTELYEKLREDGENPVFYVSSSAWNLYGMVTQILELGGVPRGPVMLQRLGLANNRFVQEPGHRHKLAKVETLLAAYPGLNAILIGDSGQHDARLYVDAAHRNPGRVRAIYIRDVEPEQRTGDEAEVQRAVLEAEELLVPMRRI